MRSMLLALSFAAALSIDPTSFAGAPANAAATQKTATVTGTVAVCRDKSGNVSMVSLKTDNGSVLVPSSANDAFAPFEGKKVKACCAIQGQQLVPVSVSGLVQAAKIPASKYR